MKNWLKPVTLTGNLIELIPLTNQHRNDLLEAAGDGKLWELWYTYIPSEATIDSYLAQAFLQQSHGTGLPFAVVNKKSKSVIGSTRFLNAEPEHKRLEIGSTWYGKSHQRTGVNTECKYLLLKYCFEQLGTIAVEFRTHWHNHDSRNAILRIGAKQDGVLRNHRILSPGLLRDTVVFSIIRSEWPTIKASLEHKMKKYN